MANEQATIADIARELKLSTSTVSRALRKQDCVTEATMQRVSELAKQLNYQPNHLAVALRNGKSNILGVLVPHIDGRFFASVVHGIETVASKAGFRVMICQSNEDVDNEKRNIETLINAQVEGILVSLARTTLDFAHFEKVEKRGIPLVFFDRVIQGAGVNSVVLDDYAGAYQAVSHLLEQGCQRIAHFAGPQQLNIYYERHRGYVEALERHGLPIDERLIFHCNMDRASGARGMEKLLQLTPAPDGLFSASDFAALGAMDVLKKHQLRIPQDLAFAGFSNELFTDITEPRLTSVDQHCEEMGQSAVRLFLKLLEDKAKCRVIPRRIILKPTLLIRESSLRLAQFAASRAVGLEKVAAG